MKARTLTILAMIFTAASIGLVITADTAQADDLPWEPVQAEGNNPNVTEVGANRILTSNDVDLEETADYQSIYDIRPGFYGARTGENGEGIFRLDNNAYSLEEAEQLSQMSDGYREMLHSEVQIPKESEWTSISDVNVEEYHFDFHSDAEQPYTDEDGWVSANIESRQGEVPIRNFEVEIIENDEPGEPDEYNIINEDEIEIFNGDTIEYQDLNEKAIDNHFPETDREKALIPGAGTGEDDRRFEMYEETHSTNWNGDYPVVRNHYAGIARISEGAIFQDYWVVNENEIDIFSVSDYRAVELDWENTVEDGCDYDCNCDSDGNNCETCYDDVEQYETIDINYIDESYQAVILEDGGGAGEGYTNEDGFEAVITAEDPISGTIGPLSQIDVNIDHIYGEEVQGGCDSSEDWETQNTDEYVSSVIDHWEDQGSTRGIEPTGIDDVDVSAYAINEGGDEEQSIYFDIEGDQRPEENPIGQLRYVANDETDGNEDNPQLYSSRRHNSDDPVDVLAIDSPWIAFTQSLYNRVEKWDGTEDQPYYEPTTVDPTTDTMQNLHRDYLASDRYQVSGDGNMVMNLHQIEEAQTFEGIDINENVMNDPSNTTLYRTVGGPVSQDDLEVEDITEDGEATVVDIFGESKEIDLETINYRDSSIQIDVKNEDGDSVEEKTIQGTLVDDAGNGIPNREIKWVNDNHQGADNITDTTTTNEVGEFEADPIYHGSFKAEFEGDDMRDDFDTHYNSADNSERLTDSVSVQFSEGPGGMVFNMIASLYSVLHWIALGGFIIWWKSFRQKN